MVSLVRPRSKLYLAEAYMQIIGMWGLAQTARRTVGWALRLMRQNIVRKRIPPSSCITMRSGDRAAASHDMPQPMRGAYVQLTYARDSKSKSDQSRAMSA
jgi:hypothetical protein